MELRQLRHVMALAQRGSFVRAADELHITQSALTRSIRNLEDELGVRLFDRGRHGAHPTPEGRLFIERLEYVQVAINGFHHDLALKKKGEFGEVSFGMGPLVGAVFLPDLLANILNAHPRLTVETDISDVDHLLDALLKERIEFFMYSGAQIEPSAKIAVATLGSLSLSLFARAAHPLAAKPRLQQADIAAYPMVTGSMSEFIKHQRKSAAHGATKDYLENRISCNDFLILKAVTLNSDAIWLTSHALVADECKRGRLVDLTMPKSMGQTGAEMTVATLAGRSLSPPAALVLKLLKSQIKAGAAQLRH